MCPVFTYSTSGPVHTSLLVSGPVVTSSTCEPDLAYFTSGLVHTCVPYQ